MNVESARRTRWWRSSCCWLTSTRRRRPALSFHTARCCDAIRGLRRPTSTRCSKSRRTRFRVVDLYSDLGFIPHCRFCYHHHHYCYLVVCGRSENRRQPQITAGYSVLDGTQHKTVGSLFICALLYNFGLTLPFDGVITCMFYSVSACNAHKVWVIHVWWAAYSSHYYATITFPKNLLLIKT